MTGAAWRIQHSAYGTLNECSDRPHHRLWVREEGEYVSFGGALLMRRHLQDLGKDRMGSLTHKAHAPNRVLAEDTRCSGGVQEPMPMAAVVASPRYEKLFTIRFASRIPDR